MNPQLLPFRPVSTCVKCGHTDEQPMRYEKLSNGNESLLRWCYRCGFGWSEETISAEALKEIEKANKETA